MRKNFFFILCLLVGAMCMVGCENDVFGSRGGKSDKDDTSISGGDGTSTGGQSGSENGHAYVDLGLSVCWATCNVGATTPKDYGDYFAWAETSPKSEYTDENYKYYDTTLNFYIFTKYNITESEFGMIDNNITLELTDDAAYVNWGECWRMPTDSECTELIENCTWIWSEQNNGYNVIGKNGNSIFIPMTGFYNFVGVSPNYSNYWSSSFVKNYLNYARCMSVLCSGVFPYDYPPSVGQVVRPVYAKSKCSVPAGDVENIPNIISVSIGTGSDNGHSYVDMGLSVKWATCNVGSITPEDYGDYFAWAETSPKSDYSGSTYTNYDKYNNTDHKTALELIDDAAHVNWGGSWRMHTYDEWAELQMKCTWTLTFLNGVKGYKISAKNGNSIFLPAAGKWGNTNKSDVGIEGCYWTSSSYDYGCGWDVGFKSNIVYQSTYDYGRSYGLSVRPVHP